MAQTVGSYQLSSFASPSNGDALDATVVKGNDNSIGASHNSHDADPGVHLQSSTLAARPAASTAGRKWVTTTGSKIRLWFDDGSAWYEADYLNLTNGGTVAGAVVLQSTLAVTGAVTLSTALADSNLATIATAGKVSNSATTAASANTASAIVARDGSGNFAAGTITAALAGNASTATALQTARTINGVSFDGTANITIAVDSGTFSGILAAANGGTGADGSGVAGNRVLASPDGSSGAVTYRALVAADIPGLAASKITSGTFADSFLATISTAGKVANSATTATSANTASAIVARDGSGNFAAGTITAALSGNASTATALQTARAINGVSFDGTGDVTVPAAAGTLTGNTLAAGVTASSLTSVGTLAALAVSGALSLSGGVTVNNGGSFGSGHNVFANATNGLNLMGKAGSTYDLLLVNNASAGLNVMGVPTGTANALFFGTLKTADPGAGQGAWLLGTHQTASVALDTGHYVEVKIDGVVRKLALVS